MARSQPFRENNDLSLAPLLLLQNHVYLNNTWDQLSTCVREGGDAFPKANNGCEFWDLAAKDPKFNVMMNEAMRCSGNISTDAIISGFDKNAWNGLEFVVDVGGGYGHMISGITKKYPHIKGINFDLPHVIAAAPKHDGVTNVSGDMFDAIPSADAVFIKSVMHNWDDESCVKILENCKKAVPEKTGKIFIADEVLKPDCKISGGIGLATDLVMMAFTKGMQRTELQWKSVLEKGGFPRYKISQLPTIYSIIEAYPN